MILSFESIHNHEAWFFLVEVYLDVNEIKRDLWRLGIRFERRS